MYIPLYLKYVLGRSRRYIVPGVLVISFVGVAFLSAAWLFGISRSTVLGIVPPPVKLAAHGLSDQFWLWSLRVRDFPYALYRFRDPGLPVYDLVISEQSLDELDHYFQENAGDPNRDKDYKNAKFFSDGREYDVRVSYRGDEDIHFIHEKKSWRIKFSDDSYFEGMKALNLIIPEDRLFLIEEFDNDRAKKLGIPAPESRFAILRLNGWSLGVYWMVEQWGPAMLEKARLNSDANLYGEVGFGGDIYNRIELWQKYAENPNQPLGDFSELAELLELLRHPSDEYFWKHIPSLVDMEAFYRWQILNVLAGASHADTAHNARLYFDPTIGRFQFLPWDVYMEPVSEWNLKDHGIDFIDYNPLIQRILRNPAYLDARNKLLWEYVKDDDELNDDLAAYDRLFGEVRTAFFQDTKKRYPNSFFLSEVRRARSIIAENVRELREMFRAGMVNVHPTINVSSAENRLTFEPIALRLDVSVTSLPPMKLETMVIKGIPTGAGRITVYEDTNASGVLDYGDRAIGNGSLENDGSVRAEGLGVVMQGRLETLPEETGFELGRTWLRERTYRFFVLAGGASLSNAAVSLDLRNEITGERMSVSSDRIINAALFGRRDDVDRSISDFLLRYPMFFQSGPRALTLPSGSHLVSETIMFPAGISLVVMPGASVFFGPGVSLFISGALHAEGTEASPISFRRLNPEQPWGTIAVVGASDTSVVRFARFDGGSGDYQNGIFTRAMASFFSSLVEISDSSFTRAAHDDSLNVKDASVSLVRSRFEGNAFDAVDFDFVTGEVRENLFRANGNDGLDISGSKLLIRDNFFITSGDKGISVGEDSRPDIVNNIIVSGNIGIAVKDSSRALILGNTITGNTIGLELYQKKQVFSGGEATVLNSILWGNGTEITVDSISHLVLGSSNVEGGWQGDGVASVLPHFVNSALGDYTLLNNSENSILLTAGTNREIVGVYGERYAGSARMGATLASGIATP